jgi:thiol-disulfide isomerase/thioredoxin
MKLFITILFLFATVYANAQAQFQMIPDEDNPGETIPVGIINKQLVMNDTSKWYAQNQKSYKPDTSVISAFEQNKNALSYIIFGGTWCDDTRVILPKFFVLQEKAGIPDDRISFFAVNREKQTAGNVASAFNIINVPTIIVMKNGKEIGRVVEYGTTGKWDYELANILNQ